MILKQVGDSALEFDQKLSQAVSGKIVYSSVWPLEKFKNAKKFVRRQ